MSPYQSKVYQGKVVPHHNYQVLVNGERLRNLSYPSADSEDSGFAWGYGGGGPNALAHSLLFDFFEGDDELDTSWEWGNKPPWIHFWMPFLDWFVRSTPQESEWTLTGDEIAEWIATLPEYDFAAWEAYIQHYPPSDSR